MDRADETLLLGVVGSHTAAAGAEVRVIVSAVKEIGDAALLGCGSKKSSHDLAVQSYYLTAKLRKKSDTTAIPPKKSATRPAKPVHTTNLSRCRSRNFCEGWYKVGRAIFAPS